MRGVGASGITTRFQELFRCMGQVGHALLTRSPLSPPGKARWIPFDLHVLSTPPAFILSQNRTLHKKNFAESQHVTLKNKKIDDRLIRKGASHENLTVLQGLPATRERADDELAIIDYKEVVQIRS